MSDVKAAKQPTINDPLADFLFVSRPEVFAGLAFTQEQAVAVCRAIRERFEVATKLRPGARECQASEQAQGARV